MKIEVLIPCFNSERCIERAVTSVVAQSRPADRITLHDDASTDATARVMARLRELHPRIRLIHSERNVGILASRQKLVRESDADVLCVLDHDDEWPPGYLARVAEHFGRANVVATVAGARNLDQLGRELSRERLGVAPLRASELRDGIRTIFVKYPVPTWSCLAIRRSVALGLLDLVGFPSGEEFPLLALALEQGDIEFFAEPMVCRHVGEANASLNAKKQYEAEIHILRWFTGRYPWLSNDVPSKVTSVYANSVYLHIMEGDASGAGMMLKALLRGVFNQKMLGAIGAFVIGGRMLNWLRPRR